MKRFLFLDDDQCRHDAFADITTDLPVHTDHVRTVDELRIALVTNEVYDCVFLDHDLGDFGPSEENGVDAADFIALHLALEKRPRGTLVHSHNPEGAKTMVDLLVAAGIPSRRAPFQAGLRLEIKF